MRYNQLGRTGLFVSEICLGTMTFGGQGGFWPTIGNLQQAEVDRVVGRSIVGLGWRAKGLLRRWVRDGVGIGPPWGNPKPCGILTAGPPVVASRAGACFRRRP